MCSNAPLVPRSRRSRPTAIAPAFFLAAIGLAGAPAWTQQPSEGPPEPPAATDEAREESQSVESQSSTIAAKSSANANTPTTEDAPAVSSGGFRVFVDPETGQILEQPRPEQIQTLQALERQRLASPSGALEPEPVRLFSIPGGVGADLPPSTMSSTVLRVLPDGSFETLCVDHSAEADHVHEANESERPPTADREEIR